MMNGIVNGMVNGMVNTMMNAKMNVIVKLPVFFENMLTDISNQDELKTGNNDYNL